jgi:hypothetical protein
LSSAIAPQRRREAGRTSSRVGEHWLIRVGDAPHGSSRAINLSRDSPSGEAGYRAAGVVKQFSAAGTDHDARRLGQRPGLSALQAGRRRL